MEVQSHKGSYTVEFDDESIERFAEWDFDTTHFIVDLKVAQHYPVLLQPVLEAPSVLDEIESKHSPDLAEITPNNRLFLHAAAQESPHYWRRPVNLYRFIKTNLKYAF